jgi:crotonobetainyl-CoA:carnitine CoA-transferase CaiB-like acyl-CoA transferase
MDITGDPAGLPTKIGTSIADLITGQYASQAIMAALLERAGTGMGHHVDISMLDCMASLLTFNAGIYFTTGESPKRRGNAHPTIAPYETFQAADGWLNIGVANDKFWQLFCGVIERPDLADDRRYAKAIDRVPLRAELVPIVAREIAAQPRSYWISRLRAAGVPYGDIRSIEEVCRAEQLVTRGMVAEMPHPTAGQVKNIISPFRFEDQATMHHVAPPLLGQHTSEVLGQLLGMAQEQLAGLQEKGVLMFSSELTTGG